MLRGCRRESGPDLYGSTFAGLPAVDNSIGRRRKLRGRPLDVVNAVLILAPFAVFAIGMVSPRAVLWWQRKPERIMVIVLAVGLFFFDIGIGMWLTPFQDQDPDPSTPPVAIGIGVVFLGLSALQARRKSDGGTQ